MSYINKWNKLDEKIKSVTSFSLFKASLLKKGRPHALNEESLVTVLLFGSKIYNEQVNVQILYASIDYIIDSNRFTGSLI